MRALGVGCLVSSVLLFEDIDVTRPLDTDTAVGKAGTAMIGRSGLSSLLITGSGIVDREPVCIDR